MTNTTNLGLPFLAAGQAQKHVTLNESLLALDALVQLGVRSRNALSPPPGAVPGDRHLVPAGATGIWAGKDGQLVVLQDGYWAAHMPREGWLAWVEDEALFVVFRDNGWSLFQGLPDSLPQLGINATPDATNRLIVSSPASLFDHAGQDHRLKVNRASGGQTASVIFQSAYSGRAEAGLLGNDHFSIKVSADGTTWKTALDINAADGAVTVPLGLTGDRAGFRNRLINGDFRINQRGASGTITLAAGAYGHDRWKAGAAGCSYTFAQQTNGDVVLTIQTGSLLQVVEGAHLADTGAFVASWSGTATARLYQGAPTGTYGAAPQQASGWSPGTDGAIEFSTGTLTRVQLEPGTVATAFERRTAAVEFALCQRYFQLAGGAQSGVTEGSSAYAVCERLAVPMRVSPWLTIRSGISAGFRYLGSDRLISSPTLIVAQASTDAYWAIVGGDSGITSGIPTHSRFPGNTFLCADAEL